MPTAIGEQEVAKYIAREKTFFEEKPAYLVPAGPRGEVGLIAVKGPREYEGRSRIRTDDLPGNSRFIQAQCTPTAPSALKDI